MNLLILSKLKKKMEFLGLTPPSFSNSKSHKHDVHIDLPVYNNTKADVF